MINYRRHGRIYHFLVDLLIVSMWLAKGKVPPTPHRIKQNLIKQLGKNYNLHTFIETGTYLGVMVEAVMQDFENIYSIELDKEIYKYAKGIFKGNRKVKIIQGDSSEALKPIIKNLKENALFWLDAHYSDGITAKGEKNTPVEKELKLVFSNKKFNHLILIDDARLFNGTSDYPTLNKLKKMVKRLRPNYRFLVKEDLICLFPKNN